MAACIAFLLWPSAAAAEELRWDETRPRFRPIEYVVTGVATPIAIAEYFAVSPASEPKWVGGILFDDAVRDALRLRSPAGLRAAWALADGMGVSLVLIVGVLDSIVIPIARGSVDVAWQTSMMNGQSFALGSLLTFTLYDTIGRARPSYADCQRGTITYGCGGSMFASFPSGHIHEAFTAAGLSCAHHLWGRIYGNRIADVFACTRDLVLGTTEAFLRVMGDRHWASDVIVGSAIGFGFGFGLPTLLHYVRWNRPANLTPAAMLGPVTGLSVRGTF